MTCSNEPSPSGSRRRRHRDGYRCVDAQKAAGFPVAAACKAAGVTRSACDAWATSAAQAAAERQREEARLVREIRRIHTRSKATYGAPRVTAELRRRG